MKLKYWVVFTLVTGVMMTAFQNFAPVTPRKYLMGFSYDLSPLHGEGPEKRDPVWGPSSFKDYNLKIWSKSSDAGLAHIVIPWDAILKKIFERNISLQTKPTETQIKTIRRLVKRHVRRKVKPIINRYRALQVPIIVTVDFRAQDDIIDGATSLEVTDDVPRRVYIEFLKSIALLEPTYLGVAAEVNFLRNNICGSNKTCERYTQVVSMIQDGVQTLKTLKVKPKLYVSYQVEAAWDDLTTSSEIDKALGTKDFPFADAVALSTFPFTREKHRGDISAIPLNYFRRLTEGMKKPVLVVESGWPTDLTLGSWQSNEDQQKKWIEKLFEIADQTPHLVFVGQLSYPDWEPNLNFVNDTFQKAFGTIGLIKYDFPTGSIQTKPALEVWKQNFARPLR